MLTDLKHNTVIKEEIFLDERQNNMRKYQESSL